MPIHFSEIEKVLSRFEGGVQCVGYIPCHRVSGGTANYKGNGDPSDYRVMGISGVTVGRGVDLGQTDTETLRRIGVPEGLIDRVSPYLGKRETAAIEALHETPLSLSNADAEILSACMLRHHIGLIAARYDLDAGDGAFESLPWQAQAVITSILYQRGVNSPKYFPNTWRALVNQDWCDAASRFRNGTLWEGYQSRRKAEGEILAELC